VFFSVLPLGSEYATRKGLGLLLQKDCRHRVLRLNMKKEGLMITLFFVVLFAYVFSRNNLLLN
jgi:hypothetical protein